MAALARQSARLLRRSFLGNSVRSGSSVKKWEENFKELPETSTEGFYSELTGKKLKDAKDMSPEQIQAELGFSSNQQRGELLASIKGIKDPYDMSMHKQGQFNDGTAEFPIIVPTTSGERLVGCVCEEDMGEVNWMVVYDGTKKQCFCGNWFQCVKIPGSIDH